MGLSPQASSNKDDERENRWESPVGYRRLGKNNNLRNESLQIQHGIDKKLK